GQSFETSGILRVSAKAVSRLPFERLEIVCNGVVVADQSAVDQRGARLEREIVASTGGWIGARGSRGWKKQRCHPGFRPTSPIYFKIPGTPFRHAAAAGEFVDEIEESMRFVRKNYRFASEADKALALGRFEQGRLIYAKLVAQGL